MTSGKQTISVSSSAAEVDVDAFGVDLGLGVPVAALQIKKSDDQCCVDYQVYSLGKPPRMLQTITGGSFFRAADTDLDGRVEIWTDHAAAVNEFEHLSLAELDSAPTLVLRFERGKLLDVSSEFQPYFDDEIARFRQNIRSDDLQDFKSSDGKLAPGGGPLSLERIHKLRQVKIRVLEITWAYLYSGREQQAWNTLAEMWPASDVPRIRKAILELQSRAVGGQTVTPASPEMKAKKRVTIFDAITKSPEEKSDLVPPQAIMLTRPGSPDVRDRVASTDALLLLVVDAAGKVRSVEPVGKDSVDPALVHAAASWKFIPALKNGHAVACRMRLSVSLRE